MRQNKKYLSLVILVVFLSFISIGFASAEDVTGCMNITSSGVYTLINDVSSQSTCFFINSSDVILDCNGNIINYSSSEEGYGIYIENANNVTIKNCYINLSGNFNYSHGIYLKNIQNSTIRNNTIYTSKEDLGSTAYSNDYGIYFYGVINVSVINNTIITKGYYGRGIQCYKTSTLNYTNIINNTFNTSGSYSSGIYWDNDGGLASPGIYNNNIQNNNFFLSGNSVWGIYIFKYPYNNLVQGNTFELTGDNIDGGIKIWQEGNNNSIINNFLNLSEDGVILLGEYMDNIKIVNNSVFIYKSRSDYAIYVRSTTNSLIANNTIWSNLGWSDYYGLYLSTSSTNNNITGNNIYYEDEAVYLDSTSGSNMIYNNLFNGSVYFGDANTLNTTLHTGTNIVGGPYIGGNYWGMPDGTGFSDTCDDEDNNGICDTNYTITSTNIDYLPLSLPDYVPPNTITISPSNNTRTNNPIITFSCNISDDKAIGSLALHIFNSSGDEIYQNTTNLSGVLNSSSWSYTFSYDDNFVWYCSGKDAAGNENTSSNYTLLVDFNSPSLSIISPESGSFFEDSSLDILFLVYI